MSFINDFQDANAGWNAIKPEILKYIKGDLIDIESMSDSALSGMFDKYSGIDAIQVVNQQMRGVAIRVQWGKDWGTFTIRYRRLNGVKTEYEKRCEAIFSDHGFWYPYLTIQVYLDRRNDGEPMILNCGIVKTLDLYEYIRDHLDEIPKRLCHDLSAEFLFIPFKKLAESQSHIIIFKQEKPLIIPKVCSTRQIGITSQAKLL